MNKKYLGQKSFLQYWKVILVESWVKSWEKWGMWGIILPAIVSLLFAVILNIGKPVNNILGEHWMLYGFLFLVLYFLTVGFFVLKEPVIVHNKQQKDIQDLKNKIETRKANIKIEKYSFPNHGQATKVGISIENEDENDLIPKIKIIGDITRTKRYYTDVDIDPIKLNNENRVIDFKEKIAFKSFGNMSIAEIQGDNIVLLLDEKLFLARVKDVLEGDYYDWDFNFEFYGSVNNKAFENGLYSGHVQTKSITKNVYLQIDIKNFTEENET